MYEYPSFDANQAYGCSEVVVHLWVRETMADACVEFQVLEKGNRCVPLVLIRDLGG